MARSYDSWLQDYDGWLEQQPKPEYHIKRITEEGVEEYYVYDGAFVVETFKTEEDAETFIKYMGGVQIGTV